MSATKRILITGVTRGLGRALAEGFAARGHVILGCGRARDAIAEVRKRLPPPHDFAAVDVASDEAVAAWAQHLLQEGPPPDLLLNNAALMNANASLWQVPAAEFDAVIDVNIKGTANVIRHFLPAMIERGSGIIVNFSSGWGRSTSSDVAPYCATKWAIEGLTRALAQELPRGLAAIPLNPGIIDTDMLRGSFGAGAGSYPNAKQWAEKGGAVLLGLAQKDNGKRAHGMKHADRPGGCRDLRDTSRIRRALEGACRHRLSCRPDRWLYRIGSCRFSSSASCSGLAWRDLANFAGIGFLCAAAGDHLSQDYGQDLRCPRQAHAGGHGSARWTLAAFFGGGLFCGGLVAMTLVALI